jgi:putative membrane protein insertion efficiency factor
MMKIRFKLKYINPIYWALFLLIEAYWWVSKPFNSRCRYHPTCSTYARSALRERGFIESVYLIIKRLLKCNP